MFTRKNSFQNSYLTSAITDFGIRAFDPINHIALTNRHLWSTRQSAATSPDYGYQENKEQAVVSPLRKMAQREAEHLVGPKS